MQRRFIKKADIALIAVILCVGAALLIWRFLPSNGKTEAVIYAGGEVYRRVTLDKSADITITPDTDPKVVIKIKDGAVWFEDADCRDKLCVKSGKLTRPGDTAACLPAGVVIRLELTGISKSPAIFDKAKLDHFNAVYLRSMSPEDFAKVAEPYIRQSVKGDFDICAIAGLLQARCEKLTEIPEKVDFFDACPDCCVDAFTNKKSKTNPEVCKTMLEAAIPMLETLPDWTDESIHDGLVALAEKLGVKNATLMWPVRIAASGKLVTPGGAVEICRILGKDETLRRLNAGLAMLGA